MPGSEDTSILDDGNDPDLSLETSDDPVSLNFKKYVNGMFLNGVFFTKQELEAIKARVREMEEEAEKLKQMQTEVTNEMTSPAGSGSAASLNMSFEEKVQIDGRYVFVNFSRRFIPQFREQIFQYFT